MSLQRGSYGIEYDERQSASVRKFWLLVAVIPAGALGVLFVRGCGHGHADAGITESGGGHNRRYEAAPEVKVPRERPSLVKHLLNAWWTPDASTAQRKSATTATAVTESGWRASKAAPPAVPTAKVQSQDVKQLLDQAAAREAEDDRVGARLILQQVLVRRDADDVRAFAERKIGSLNTALAFSVFPMPAKVKHRVAAGDLIGKLAKQYGCTQEYILKVNGIDKPELLRIGREIWVLKNPAFELTVFKRNNSAVLTLGNQFFKRYTVGVGKTESVPGGTYVIRSKAKRTAYPTSENGDGALGNPQNSLGTHWIALAATGTTPEVKGFGLHGTWNESTLGRQVDAGRVRFRNADIEELCTLLIDGTPVNIAE
ncbi:MAG: L,D-transpeptidase family protein [bacterium]